MRHLKIIILTFFAFALTGCATSSNVDYDGINASIESGKMGGVIGGFSSIGPGSTAILNLENVNTGAENEVTFKTFPRYPTVYSLAPGTYKVKSGTYDIKHATFPISGGKFRSVRTNEGIRYNSTGELPFIGLLTKEFEVKSGEVVDLGSLSMKPFKLVDRVGNASTRKALRGATVGVSNIWLDPKNPLELGTPVDAMHMSYNIWPIDKDIKKLAMKKFSNLESSVVKKPLHLTIRGAEYRDIVRDASANNANGVAPTRSIIRDRISASIATTLQNRPGSGAPVTP